MAIVLAHAKTVDLKQYTYMVCKDSAAWLRDYITAIKHGQIHPFTPLERKAREATRNEAWGPTGTLLNELAEATNDPADCEIVMAVVQLRLGYPPPKWRNVYKALTVLDFLLKRGAEGVVTLARAELGGRLEALEAFAFVTPEGRDQGVNVRHRAAGETKGVSAEDARKHAAALRGLLARPENRSCADCVGGGAAARPTWASINTGVFICMRCAGIHRGLGVHISKVRSVTLDTWLPEQVAFMAAAGNAVANAYWEARLEPTQKPSHESGDVEGFVRRKYNKEFAEGAWPPPATAAPAAPTPQPASGADRLSNAASAGAAPHAGSFWRTVPDANPGHATSRSAALMDEGFGESAFGGGGDTSASAALSEASMARAAQLASSSPVPTVQCANLMDFGAEALGSPVLPPPPTPRGPVPMPKPPRAPALGGLEELFALAVTPPPAESGTRRDAVSAAGATPAQSAQKSSFRSDGSRQLSKSALGQGAGLGFEETPAFGARASPESHAAGQGSDLGFPETAAFGLSPALAAPKPCGSSSLARDYSASATNTPAFGTSAAVPAWDQHRSAAGLPAGAPGDDPFGMPVSMLQLLSTSDTAPARPAGPPPPPARRPAYSPPGLPPAPAHEPAPGAFWAAAPSEQRRAAPLGNGLERGPGAGPLGGTASMPAAPLPTQGGGKGPVPPRRASYLDASAASLDELFAAAMQGVRVPPSPAAAAAAGLAPPPRAPSLLEQRYLH